MRLVLSAFFAALMLASSSVKAAGGPIEITVLYDNYTLTEGCTPDWDFACITKGTEKCFGLASFAGFALDLYRFCVYFVVVYFG